VLEAYKKEKESQRNHQLNSWKRRKNGIKRMPLSAPPDLPRATTVLCRYDSCTQPRGKFFFQLFRDIFIFDDSPFVHDRRRISQSRGSFRSAANENEGSILAVGNGDSLDTPADRSLSLASLVDCNHLSVFILNEHWRPGGRQILAKTDADWIYRNVSHINGGGVMPTTSASVENERCDSVHGMHGMW
jgi:hypothetical protein